ncbi:MAG: hypothetical protein NC489_31035 [Ruminococcus flavefaciens]|nr:hypothetical protein [Ruminococcus flavefaciens]
MLKGEHIYYNTTFRALERGAEMSILKAAVFISSLLSIPLLAFLLVLCICIDMVRTQQESLERGDTL